MPTNYETILGTLVSGEDVPLLQADRRRHVYLIGMTGTGKTGLLLNMMHADLLWPARASAFSIRTAMRASISRASRRKSAART